MLPPQKCTLKAKPLFEINSNAANNPLKNFFESIVQKYFFKIDKATWKSKDYVNKSFASSENKTLAQKAIEIAAESKTDVHRKYTSLEDFQSTAACRKRQLKL